MSNYLIELSIIHVALILGYWCFLRKERQYAAMRFYLIGATLLALIIPLIKLPKLFFNSKEPMIAVPIEAIEIDAMAIATAPALPTRNFDPFVWIYGLISILLLCKLIGGMLYIIYLERRSSYEKFNDLYIRKVADIKGSFTFFNWIFFSHEIDKTQQNYDAILKHEKAHASLGHTCDLLFFELFKVCFWWLPTVWFINKEIRKIHEYQADAYALKSCNIDQYSSILISATLKANGLSLASSFHDGLILKRLIAMKQQTKSMNPWKLWVLSGLCALLFIAFACSQEPDEKPKKMEQLSDESGLQEEVYTVVEELPEFEGGMDAFYDYVEKHAKYPLQALQAGVQGHVFVNFVVERDGSLSDVRSLKGPKAGCSREAVRVVQSAPRFKPGKQRGKPVRVRMVMPVTFTLHEDETNEDNPGRIITAEAKIIENKFRVDAKYAGGEWSGTIYDEGGEALPGANIIVAGTTHGTVSDIDGTFRVKAAASNDLHISFVGYESVRLEGR